MIKLLLKLKEQITDVNTYIRDSSEDVRIANLKIFQSISIIGVLAIVAVSIVTMIIMDPWKPSKYHIAFFGIMVLFAILGMVWRKNGCHSRKLELVVERAFVAIILIAITLIDTLPSPGSGQIFVGVFLSVAPILFIVSVAEVICFQIGFLALFSIISFSVKTPEVAGTDLLGALIGFAMGFVIYLVVMRIRVDEFNQKNDYKLSSELDALTGIANRSSCKSKVDFLLAQKKSGEPCAMLVLDVDDFKRINDTLGHSKGDEVLIGVANILRQTFRKSDVVARFGGDEFVVFLTGFNDINFLKRKCKDINDDVGRILDGRFNIQCTMGICTLKYGHATLEKMFKIADDALYEAKTFDKGNFAINEYDEEAGKKRVPLMVIVDDNPIDREVMAVQFEEEFLIEKFGDAIEAIEYIKANSRKISIVLLDMVMPDISGLEFLDILGAEHETKMVPVVVVSSNETTEADALEHGADDMIIKPVIPAVAKLRVKNVLDKYSKVSRD